MESSKLMLSLQFAFPHDGRSDLFEIVAEIQSPRNYF